MALLKETDKYDLYYKDIRRMTAVDKVMRLLYVFSCCRVVARYIAKGRILDIGCGTGDFLKVMQKSGWQAYGVEASGCAAKKAKANVGSANITVADKLHYDFADGFFDAVTLWHVLEHVEDAAALTKEIHRMLKKGGIAVVEVPDGESPLYKLFRSSHYLHLWPEHKSVWTKDSLCLLFKQSSFVVEAAELFQRSNLALSRDIYRHLKNRNRALLGMVVYAATAPLSILDKYIGAVGGRRDLIRLVCRKAQD